MVTIEPFVPKIFGIEIRFLIIILIGICAFGAIVIIIRNYSKKKERKQNSICGHYDAVKMICMLDGNSCKGSLNCRAYRVWANKWS